MMYRSLIVFLVLPLLTVGETKVQKLLLAMKTATADSNKVKIYKELSAYYRVSNFDSASYYAKKGIELARRIKYRQGELRLLSQLAAINERHGNRVLALNYYKEALEGFREMRDQKGIAACTNGLGVIEGRQGNFSKALSYFFSALKIYEKQKDTDGVIQTYIKIGAANELNGNLDEGLRYYNEARELNAGLKDRETEVSLLNNVGIIFAKKGQMEKALNFFEEGIKKSTGKELGALNVNLLTNAGSAAENLGNREAALKYHRASLAKAEALGLPEEEARALINIATALDDKGPATSLHYLQRSLKIAASLGNKALMAEIFEAEATCYQRLKQYEKALSAVREQHKLLDSMFSISKSKEIANLQAAYDLDKSKERIKRLELSNQSRTYQRNVVIVASVSILGVLILLLFYVKKIRALNRNLRSSNQIKDKLFSIIGHDLRGPIGTVVQMLGSMEENDLQSDELKSLVSLLRKHSEASLGTLDTLLQWGKTQLQGVRVNKVRFYPESIIHKNLSVFAAAVCQKAIDITASVPAGLVLYGDPDHFDFIIRNLLSNAVKFTYPGGKIEIVATSDLRPGMVVFSVRDNGRGINKGQIAPLFESFSHSGEGTSGERGAGIGLVLCKEFVSADQGEIWVESKEGEGSAFFFSVRSAVNIKPSSDIQAGAVFN